MELTLSAEKKRILFCGDVIYADGPLMSGQGVYSKTGGDPFVSFAEFIPFAKEFDFSVGNFEAVLVEHIGMISPGNSAMKAPMSLLPVLREAGFRFMSIANNHTMEYGEEAFTRTVSALKAKGIEPFGFKDKPYITIDYGGQKIALLAFSTVPAMYGCEPLYFFVDYRDCESRKEVAYAVAEAKRQGCKVIVCPHWGSEFVSSPAPWQVELGETLIEAGADAIFGAHPHVIQSSWFFRGRPVVFSMGNLLSDYVLDECKTNVVLDVALSEGDLRVNAKTFTCDKEFRICRSQHEVVILQDWPDNQMTAERYVSLANSLRRRVRRRLIMHLIRTWRIWLGNRDYVRWIMSRAWYVFRQVRKIQDNPDSIYAGPIH